LQVIDTPQPEHWHWRQRKDNNSIPLGKLKSPARLEMRDAPRAIPHPISHFSHLHGRCCGGNLGAAPTEMGPMGGGTVERKIGRANALQENVNRTAGREKSAPAVCLLLMTSLHRVWCQQMLKYTPLADGKCGEIARAFRPFTSISRCIFFMALGEATLKGKLYIAGLHFRPVTSIRIYM
jgi:hypothetical protein